MKDCNGKNITRGDKIRAKPGPKSIIMPGTYVVERGSDRAHISPLVAVGTINGQVYALDSNVAKEFEIEFVSF